MSKEKQICESILKSINEGNLNEENNSELLGSTLLYSECKKAKCEWCEQKNQYVVFHKNDYYSGWFCRSCIWLSNCAAEAIEKDNT